MSRPSQLKKVEKKFKERLSILRRWGIMKHGQEARKQGADKMITTKTFTYANGRKFVKFMETKPCRRCNGNRRISCYSHIDGGICYSCGGDGYEVAEVIDTVELLDTTPANEGQAASDEPIDMLAILFGN